LNFRVYDLLVKITAPSPGGGHKKSQIIADTKNI